MLSSSWFRICCQSGPRKLVLTQLPPSASLSAFIVPPQPPSPSPAPMPPPRVPLAPSGASVPSPATKFAGARFIPGEFPGGRQLEEPGTAPPPAAEQPPSLPQLKISSPSPKALLRPPPDILGPGFARNLQAPSPSRCAEVSRRRGACAGLGAPGAAARGRDAAPAAWSSFRRGKGRGWGWRLPDPLCSPSARTDTTFRLSLISPASCQARPCRPSRLHRVGFRLGKGSPHARVPPWCHNPYQHPSGAHLCRAPAPSPHAARARADPSRSRLLPPRFPASPEPPEPPPPRRSPGGFAPARMESPALRLPLSRPRWHAPVLRAPTGEPPGQRSCLGQ